MAKIKVLIVDDSAIVRGRLAKEINNDPDLEVVGHAPDPFIARDKIVSLKPDVITLDMQMPRMDGLTFLKKLMSHHPLPVIVISSYTAEGQQLTLDALEVGAIEVLEKPAFSSGEMETFGVELCDKIKAAAKSRVRPKRQITAKASQIKQTPITFRGSANSLIALGASTGGTEALLHILKQMPANCPPILIVQHMPKGFTQAFATRLNSQCEIEILEGENNMKVKQGRAIIAPGDKHMLLKHNANERVVQLKDGPPVCRHKPSVEVLFNSVAQIKGNRVAAALLTGMGRDGANGLLNLKNAGANTIAQDENSCVVFGMPKEAIVLGAANQVVSLDKIAGTLLRFLQS
jgi:two-component system chemotaxis response regulator CheB